MPSRRRLPVPDKAGLPRQPKGTKKEPARPGRLGRSTSTKENDLGSEQVEDRLTERASGKHTDEESEKGFQTYTLEGGKNGLELQGRSEMPLNDAAIARLAGKGLRLDSNRLRSNDSRLTGCADYSQAGRVIGDRAHTHDDCQQCPPDMIENRDTGLFNGLTLADASRRMNQLQGSQSVDLTESVESGSGGYDRLGAQIYGTSNTNSDRDGLNSVFQVNDRLEKMGLTREAAQSAFRDMHEQSTQRPPSKPGFELMPKKADGSLDWNHAKERSRSRSHTEDTIRSGETEKPNAGLGISGVKTSEDGEEARQLDSKDRTSTIALPSASSDGGSDCSSLVSEDVECDDGIMAGGQSDRNAARTGSVLSVDLCDSEGELVGEESISQDGSDQDRVDQPISKARSIARHRELDDLISDDTEFRSDSDIAFQEQLQQVAGGSRRDYYQLGQQSINEKALYDQIGPNSDPRGKILCTHDRVHTPSQGCYSCLYNAQNELRAAESASKAQPANVHPIDTEDRSIVSSRNMEIETSSGRDDGERANPSNSSNTIVVSAVPAFQEITKQDRTDAEFFLLWSALLEKIQEEYPDRMARHDTLSSRYHARFKTMENMWTEGRRYWSVERASRFRDDELRQLRLKARVEGQKVTHTHLALPYRERKQSAETRQLQDTEIPGDVSISSPVLDPPDSGHTPVNAVPLDNSWMEDPSGVVGAQPFLPKGGPKKKKRKTKRAKSTVKKTSPRGKISQGLGRVNRGDTSQDSETESDDTSEASDLDVSALVAAREATVLPITILQSISAQPDRSRVKRGTNVATVTFDHGPSASMAERRRSSHYSPENGLHSDSLSVTADLPAIKVPSSVTGMPSAPLTQSNPAQKRYDDGLQAWNVPLQYSSNHSRHSAVPDPIRDSKDALTNEDVPEGAYISIHPVTGKPIIIYPGPRQRPAYDHSVFVAGITKVAGAPLGVIYQAVRDHFNRFCNVDKVKVVLDGHLPVYNAFISVDTVENAHSLTKNPDAKHFRFGNPTDGQTPPVYSTDDVRIEMAQGLRTLLIRINLTLPASSTSIAPPRVHRRVPETVIYEQYLEPAGFDKQREKFRTRCRVDMTQWQPTFEWNREAEVRPLYREEVILPDKIVLNPRNAHSEVEAIRMLCQPFGEIETLEQAEDLEHPGWLVKFYDRDVAMRVNQQLRLLDGVACYREDVTKRIHGLAPRSASSLPPIPPKTQNDRGESELEIQTTGPMIRPKEETASSSGTVTKTLQTPTFAEISRGKVKTNSPKFVREEWPSLPKHSSIQASNVNSTGLSDVSQLPVYAQSEKTDDGPDRIEQHHIGSGPVKVESKLQTDIQCQTSIDIEPEDMQTEGPRRRKASLGRTRREKRDHVRLERRPFEDQLQDTNRQESSALGLSEVPPPPSGSDRIILEDTGRHPGLGAAKLSPIVSLGCLPHNPSGEQDSPIRRMTVLIQNLPKQIDIHQLRDRYKTYGRLTAAQIHSEEGDSLRSATVTYSSVAAAREAVSHEHERDIGGGCVQAVQMLPETGLSTSPEAGDQAEVQADEVSEAEILRLVKTIERPHSDMSAAGDTKTSVLENELDGNLLRHSRRSVYKRSASDPGRQTPLSEEFVRINRRRIIAVQDHASANIASQRPEIHASPLEERPTYPSIHATHSAQSHIVHPSPQYMAANVLSPASALTSEQLAAKLTEANQLLSQWQMWALQQGIQMPPSVALPPQSVMPYMDLRQSFMHQEYPSVYQPGFHSSNDFHLDAAHSASPLYASAVPLHLSDPRGQSRASDPKSMGDVSTRVEPSRSDMEGSPSDSQREATSDTPIDRSSNDPPGQDSAHLRPVKVIDTPQGLYALYDRSELLAYKKNHPETETVHSPEEAAEPAPLFPVWSGGHGPEKLSHWTAEQQYRQSFQLSSGLQPGAQMTYFPPTPPTSKLEHFDGQRQPSLYPSAMDSDRFAYDGPKEFPPYGQSPYYYPGSNLPMNYADTSLDPDLGNPLGRQSRARGGTLPTAPLSYGKERLGGYPASQQYPSPEQHYPLLPQQSAYEDSGFRSMPNHHPRGGSYSRGRNKRGYGRTYDGHSMSGRKPVQ